MLTAFALGPALTISVMEPALLSYRLLRIGFPAETRPALYGTVTFIGLVVASLAQPIMGHCSGSAQAWRRRTAFMTLGAFSAASGIAIVATASTLFALCAGVALAQFGANAAIAAWQPMISERIVHAQRGLVAGLRNGFELLAASLGRLFAAEITAQAAASTQGSALAVLALPVLGFAITLPITTHALRATPLLEIASPTPLSMKRAHPLSAFRNRAFRLWFLNRAAFWCATIMSSAFLFLVALDVLQLPEAEAQRFVAQLIVIAGVAVGITLLPAAWLADRIGRRPLLIFSGVLAAIGAASVVLDRAQVTFATVSIAVSTGVFLSASLALAGDLAPRHNAALHLGLANLATTFGSAAGRVGGGALVSIISAITQTRSEGYLALYSVAAALFMISTLSAWRLQPTEVASMQ